MGQLKISWKRDPTYEYNQWKIAFLAVEYTRKKVYLTSIGKWKIYSYEQKIILG